MKKKKGLVKLAYFRSHFLVNTFSPLSLSHKKNLTVASSAGRSAFQVLHLVAPPARCADGGRVELQMAGE